MAGRFQIIDDAFVVVRSKGVYRQVKVYERDGFIYAAYGAGYIRLFHNSGTSCPSIKIDGYEMGFEPRYTRLGYMVTPKFHNVSELKEAA